MDLLINIDNGGTLTDICVLNGARVIRTKTLTTPHDLSQCVFDGLKKASRVLYGKEDVLSLLLATSYVRYSTTQGTNALVERKGPRIGLILGGGLSGESLQYDAGSRDLYGALIGPRAQLLGVQGATEQIWEDSHICSVEPEAPRRRRARFNGLSFVPECTPLI